MNKLKHFAKMFCPPILWQLLRRFFPAVPQSENVQTRLKVRDHIELNIHPDSFIPFRYFIDSNPDMVEEFDSFLRLSSGCKRLLDVGAAQGFFSLNFCKEEKGRSAVALEPSPTAFPKLLYNIYKNPDCHVKPMEVALSDTETSLMMGFEWEHLVAIRSSPPPSNSLKVPAERGDTLCKRLSFFPDAIKIDVEGHELNVLLGLEECLKKYRPILFLELHPAHLNNMDHGTGQILSFLDEIHYTLHPDTKTCKQLRDIISITTDTRIILKYKES